MKNPNVFLFLCFVLAGPHVATAAQPTRPNIVFFFADDQRYDALSCAGHPIVRTPTIDRLAADGVRFRNAFVTTSVCWVSRAVVLTGRWARTHAQRGVVPTVTSQALSTTQDAAEGSAVLSEPLVQRLARRGWRQTAGGRPLPMATLCRGHV